MTITIGKKQIYGLLAIVLIGCCILLGYKSCGKVDYESTAKNMKLNAWITTSYAAQILSDYQTNWRSAINDHRAINADGKSDYCYEFSTAIAWRFLYYTKNGHIKLLDSLSNAVKEDMKLMEDAPSKYQETQKSFLGLYNDMNTLVSLVKDPKGSLMTFGQRVNELMLDFENKYNETDLKISISEADKNAKVLEIQTALNNLIANSPEMKARSQYKEQNEKFLKDNAKKDGVKTLPSGVQYKILKEGNGAIPKEDSKVKVHYEGSTIDGNVFDSSYKRGDAIDLRANQVIKGWTEALIHMPAGSIWEVYIPQELGYAEREQGDIKPYSTLIFKIELLKVYQ